MDQFLQNHRKKANLETLRDDLGIYLKVLRSAMIELINKDYADFVNLSSNLNGLDKAITGIQVPLGQLKEEVLVCWKFLFRMYVINAYNNSMILTIIFQKRNLHPDKIIIPIIESEVVSTFAS